MVLDGYAQSTLLSKLKKRKKINKPLNIAFLDIDSTMTGSNKTTNATRQKLEKLGYVIVYVTARTEEMLMSSDEYKLSINLGFKRPLPRIGREREKYVYAKPELVEPEGLLNPDIIAGSTGTQILIKQKDGGFALDAEYEESFEDTSEGWRQSAMSIIHAFNTPKKRAFPALYEYPKNYNEGLTDIFQPKFRIAISFQGTKDKKEFRSFVKKQKSPNSLNIRLIDDSEPRRELFTIYLIPKNGGKRKAVDKIVKAITDKLNVAPFDLHVLIAGDGHSDFDMGMKAARGTCLTYLLPGGSRLMPALRCIDEHPELMEEELEQLKTYLSSLETKGFYKSQMHANRQFIICDEVYKGKLAVDSIYALLPNLEVN